MLTNTRISALINAINDAKACAKPCCAALRDEAQQAINDAMLHRAAVSKARPEARGRPLAALYEVELGSQWRVEVLGARAAHEIVAKTLTEQGGGRAPTLGSMQVSLSKNGQWWRLLETGNGTEPLSVRRIKRPLPAETDDKRQTGE